jgi:hypothetical protein
MIHMNDVGYHMLFCDIEMLMHASKINFLVYLNFNF